MTRIETAVILAIELVGSTPLGRRVGDAGFEDLRREHDATLGHAIEDHGGRVIKHTGDGLLASFPSVTAAIAAGVVIQQHGERRRQAADVATSIRVGISVGDAAVEEGDYFGIAPIEATRLCAKARSGEIIVADPARAMVRAAEHHRFEALAPLELKGLPEPVTAWRVGWDPFPATDRADPSACPPGSPPTRFVERAGRRATLDDRTADAVRGKHPCEKPAEPPAV